MPQNPEWLFKCLGWSKLALVLIWEGASRALQAPSPRQRKARGETSKENTFAKGHPESQGTAGKYFEKEK